MGLIYLHYWDADVESDLDRAWHSVDKEQIFI